jgi:SNF2-related domain/Helicase conserved C-terminal domain
MIGWKPSKQRNQQSSSPWRAVADGWQYEPTERSTPATSIIPALGYLMQLAEEGLANPAGDGFVVPWSSVYALLRNPDHASSVPLLELPEERDWVPRLESRGTPSDADFSVGISNWRLPTNLMSSTAATRIGACVKVGEGMTLMPEGTWRLVRKIEELNVAGAKLSANERLLATGRIIALAKDCSADLDDYLLRTGIVAADRLELELEKTDILGAPVVTITPKPVGAPDSWIRSFDRFDTVRERYDIPTADGGLSHVVTSAAVREALEPIKKMVGRSVASDSARAFLYNPYGVLGDGAAEALQPDTLEKAREAAGVRFRRLVTRECHDRTACTVHVVDPSGREEDSEWSLSYDEAIGLIRNATRSQSRGLPLFSWDGEEIELGGETDHALQAIRDWIASANISAAGLQYAEVFDLSAYSDRVVGFEGKSIIVPYVARKRGEQGWLPENIETGITISAPGSHRPVRVPLSPEEVVELAGRVEEARARNQDRVEIPGTDATVPTDEARHWLKAFQEHHHQAKQRTREPALAKNPPPSASRPILQILHNIESLDYGTEPIIERVPAHAEPHLPNALRPNMQPLSHQRIGIAWLQHRFRQQAQGVRGALLADDMGVGKTMQALCLVIEFLEQSDYRRPCLIVAPVSLLENWKAEILKFFDSARLRVLALYGRDLQERRLPVHEVDAELVSTGLRKFLRPDFAADHPIVLTTYETLRDYEFSIARVSWGIVVCDEAQKIKNPGAFVTRAAKALRADFKIACTGTPVENSLADLWCLFDFFQPGLLGSLNEFTRLFRRAIETREEGHETLIDSLRKAIDPWILRRMKTDVTSLPPKIEHGRPDSPPGHMPLAMSSLQERLYSEAIGQFRRALQSEDGKENMLATLDRLRTICSNPAKAAFGNSEALPISDHIEHSPKLAWLLRQLAEIRQRGEKVLVFTEFREIQRLIQRAIFERFHMTVSIVNGSTSVDPGHEASRQRIIDEFQAAPGFNVIILSTTAVGFGVNIQAANHVVHFTRPWNPAKEDQATDRAYRIGQTKPVYVYCPTVTGSGFETFDQRVDALLGGKRMLSQDILSTAQVITLEDFRSL